MQLIPLTNLPNQSIAFNAGGVYWQIKIYQSATHMCADIEKEGAMLARGIRCFKGIPLLQYDYQYLPNLGNFLFDSDVDFTNFGNSCNLYYLDQPELAQFNSLMLSGV